MNKNEFQKLAEQVRALSTEKVLAIAALCDGHSIRHPHAFLEAGLPSAVVTHLTRTFKADGSPKGTPFVNGMPMAELTGVYGLQVLHFLAAALNVNYAASLGRGSEARNIQTALHQRLGK